MGKIEKQLQHLKEERGQSIVILAFAFIGLVAMLGLALDLGLVYIERVALKRAIDASVLGGVIELPIEEDAGSRAWEYLRLNGYDPNETVVFFQGCVRDDNGLVLNQEESDEFVYWAPASITLPPTNKVQAAKDNEAVRNIFYIDTKTFQDPDNNLGVTQICNETNGLYGTANKLRVSGEVKVNMNFMRIVPPFWRFVTVGEEGIAQNIDNLDVAIVMDRSGSMEFDPVSYGNWERTQTPQEPNPSGAPLRWFDYFNYPANGIIYPVGYNDGEATDGGFGHPRISGAGGVCDTAPGNPDDFTYTEGGNHYIVMEAELYSRNNTTADLTLRETAKGYWAMQRGEGHYITSPPYTPPYYPSTGASIDARPAHMAHHPSLTSYEGAAYGFHYALTHAADGDAPLLEYDFKFRDGNAFNWAGSAYIWVRVHAGRGLNVDNNQFGDTVGPRNDAYWTVISEPDDGGLAMDAIGFNPNTIKPVQNIPDIPINNGTGWAWVRLQNPVPANANNINRLYIYAGATGFSIDRIVVTDNPSGQLSNLPLGVRNGTVIATTGSGFRAACSPCNVIYGENIGEVGSGTPYELDDCGQALPYIQPINQALDPIFSDFENPMRSAKEAVKLFVTKLDPEKDQVGFVSYTTNSGVGTGAEDVHKTELECILREGPNICPTAAVSFTQVLRDIEDVSAIYLTNTGAGMKAGLEILGIDLYNPQPTGPNDCSGTHCSRGASAQRIMILLTDGVPTRNAGAPCTAPNPAYGLPIGAAADDGNHRCPMYFAQQAANRGVSVYVIGLGYGVNSDYLKAVAEIGGGQYYFSASGGDLELIFSEILNNIFVRLVK